MEKASSAGKITTPQCPRCGLFMDKVEAVVLNQLSGGTVPVSTSIGQPLSAKADSG